MKVIAGAVFVVGALVIFAVAGLGLVNPSTQNHDFLRLHIRANSNSDADQAVKYLVKQQIVNELTPIFVDVVNRAQAMHALDANLTRIENIANKVLSENGFIYRAVADIRSEFFPTRAYMDLTLPSGIYDALIITLGAGEGDNWWCVIYPPLCFLENNIGGEAGVRYRSRLLDLIRGMS